MEALLTAGDTAAAWWRTQTVSYALSEHDDASFKSWSRDDDLGYEERPDAQDGLVGAWLTASLSGAKGFAASVSAKHAHHQLIHHEVEWRRNLPSNAIGVALNETGENVHDDRSHHDRQRRGRTQMESAIYLREALDQLRRYGHHDDLAAAAGRLWAAGPTLPLRNAATRSIEVPWTHTNARSKLAILEQGGDLLEESSAGDFVRESLDVFRDDSSFVRRVRPTFIVDHYVFKALRGVLLTASDNSHRLLVERLVEMLPRVDDALLQLDIVETLPRVRTIAFHGHEEALFSSALESVNSRFAATLLGRLLGNHARSEQELVRRAASGDRYAVGELDASDALSSDGAAALIAREVSACDELIESAKKGSYAYSDWDSARALTAASLNYPHLARWDPILALLLNPKVSEEHKCGVSDSLIEIPKFLTQFMGCSRSGSFGCSLSVPHVLCSVQPALLGEWRDLFHGAHRRE